MGWFERARAKLLLDLDVPRPYRPDPTRDRWWRVPVSRLTDPATWTEIVYHLLLLPIGAFTFTVAFTFWVLGASLLFLPVYAWALPEPVHAFDSWVKVTLDARPSLDLVGGGSGWVIDTPIEYAALVLIGAAVLLLTPWVVRGLATANRYPVRGLLGSDVFARVQTLTDSRAAAVDLAAEDRRRIERDLHDGVQQRLVSLAMDLGRAKEKLDTDPDRAKELVDEAHEEAKRAITEVRDLARGIHPAVLTDRGLDAALSALAARSSVPVEVRVDVAERPPASVEAAAYFVVSEALANVAKHGKAARANVTVRRSEDRLDGAGPGRRRGRGVPRRGLRPRRPARPRGRARRGAAPALAGGRADGPDGGDPVRIVIAEDGVLLREGLAHLLADEGHEVAGLGG